MNVKSLGWVAAAALGGLLVGAGFDNPDTKIAYVDATAVFKQSKLSSDEQNAITRMSQVRNDALNFVSLNPVFTEDQLTQFQKLVGLDKPTPADTDALTQLKATVTKASDQLKALQQKQNPTQQDQAQLDDLGKRYSATQATLPQLKSLFGQQLKDFDDKAIADALQKIKDTVAKISKKQGYSVVFNENAATFGQYDLTDETVKEIGK